MEESGKWATLGQRYSVVDASSDFGFKQGFDTCNVMNGSLTLVVVSVVNLEGQPKYGNSIRDIHLRYEIVLSIPFYVKSDVGGFLI